MKPEFLSYPHISSYPVLLLLGFLCGYALARLRATRAGLAGSHVDNIALLLLIVGPAGSRLFSRWFELHTSFLGGFKLWEGGGLVFYGGLICGIAAVGIYCVSRRLSLVPVLDIFAPSAALGLAFGRVGCFLAGCCWGDLCVAPETLSKLSSEQIHQVQTVPALSRPSVWTAVSFPAKADATRQHRKHGLLDERASASLPVHPSQLYEAALAVGLFLLLHWRFNRRHSDGAIFLGLCAGYGVIRFAVEFLRADNTPAYFGFTLSQLISLAAIALAAVLYAVGSLTTASRDAQDQGIAPPPAPTAEPQLRV